MNTGNRDISILWVAESNWIEGAGIKPHSHDYYHMFMVRKGPIDFLVNDNLQTLNKGQAVLACPGVMHGLTSRASMGKVYEVKFTTHSPALKHLLDSISTVLPADDLAERLLQEIVAESNLQEPSALTFLSDHLLSLIDYYSRHYGTSASQISAVIDTSGFSEVSGKIVSYLEANYRKELHLQEIAENVGFNKNYICSVFKRDSGMTIGMCHTLIRIRKAAELISFSDMSLHQVAVATGFTNLSHFNRIFKKVVGIPPGHYRRMFAADILFPGAYDETQIVGQNGFIISVLGKKKLSISDILDYTGRPDSDQSPDLV